MLKVFVFLGGMVFMCFLCRLCCFSIVRYLWMVVSMFNVR